MNRYKPELGQACFGQPYKEYKASNLLEAALNSIRELLDIAMWNIHQKTYSSPFGNTGNSFECDTFKVEAYSWNDEYEQPWNFKYKDIEVGWYKYLGRGMSVNKSLTPQEISDMLNDCLEAVRKYENDNNPRGGHL